MISHSRLSYIRCVSWQRYYKIMKYHSAAMEQNIRCEVSVILIRWNYRYVTTSMFTYRQDSV